MKFSLFLARLARASLGVVLLAGLSAPAQVRPTHRPDVPNLDVRAPAPAGGSAFFLQGRAALQQAVPSAEVELDPLLGTPKFIHARDGFLTGPQPSGGVGAAALPLEPFAPVRSFLNQHAALFGIAGQALDTAQIKRDHTDAHNGMRTVVWQQEVDGLPVFEGVLKGNLTRNGELITISSLFVPEPEAAAQAGTPNRAQLLQAPPVNAAEAVSVGLRNLGEAGTPGEVVAVGSPGADGYTQFQTPRSAWARLVWLPMNRAALRLSWEVYVASPTTGERFLLLVDAQNGKVLVRRSLTHYLSDITFRVWTGDSPSPWTPGPNTPSAAQPATVSRALVTFPALDLTASPEGWIPDGSNTTTGNNTDTFVDRNFDGAPDQPRPVGAPDRVFDFPIDLSQDPTNYMDGATSQMFYWVNWYHDRLYQLGFTESAGNFQQSNFGRGGRGGDPVIAYVQAGADLGYHNNAFFSTMPDGFPGEVAMFTWDGPNPERDGDLDADVILHELTHGTSQRLVGGGVLMRELQSDGMGEGWSDFYGMALKAEAGDNPDGVYPNGGYVGYRLYGLTQNYYYGDRHFPYCTDLRKNPLTFKDIDPTQISPHTGVPRSPLYPFYAGEASEVHHQGEVWCMMLWEVRANLIRKHGFAGNELMLQLVTDAMKLCPANPTFVESRDAILLADRVNNSGANVAEIWRGFAKRGLGVSAKAPPSSTTTGVVEAFDTPGVTIDHTVVTGGNGNGILDPNECDDLHVHLVNNAGYLATGVSAQLSSSTPGVIVVQPLSTYPPLPNGTTNVNDTPFKVSVAPEFVCGLPITFALLVKSDQATTTNTFVLGTGVSNGIPARFDNYVAQPIPGAGTTNSVILVTNVNFAVTRMTVSLQLNHAYDANVVLQLVSPDGVTNTLARNRGANGQNYGFSCFPDSRRTTFDDGALTPIGSGTPPFLGAFKPEEPLAMFAGKFGTNVNGAWQLLVTDLGQYGAGLLNCWSLTFLPSACADGGGECPGAELAVGLSAAPDPVMLGDRLAYTLSVTNRGPSTARNVSVSQQLPGSVVFVDAASSQGSWSQAGGVLTATLGRVPARGTASVTVTVMPTLAGILTSSATVVSEQIDLNPANNTAYNLTRVTPPTADLALGLTASPSELVVGGPVSYALSLTNQGPALASGVTVTNLLPPELLVTSVVLSQGEYAMAGNTVLVHFGNVASGQRATATIHARPVSQGTFTATAAAAANQFDPVSANNFASATVAVGAAADLGVTLVAQPNPVVLSSNVAFVATITNAGPNTATNVVLNQTLPVGAAVISATASQGSVHQAGGSLTANLGALDAGARATVTVVLATSRIGALSMLANVSGAQADPDPLNNSALAVADVNTPFVNIVGAGASLTNESFFPPNGSIEIGERVTLLFRLQNIGNVQNTNLTATLLATGGVTAPTGPQSYGILPPMGISGSLPMGRPFSFTAAGTNGGVVRATLQVQDAGGFVTNLTFAFGLPSLPTFANTNRITIPSVGAATPYPSVIQVSGVTGQVGKVTATLAGLTHTYTHDVNVLLVGPTGAKALLMANAADASQVTDANITFDDFAPAPLPASGSIYTGAYRPAGYPPMPVFPSLAPENYPSAMQAFSGVNPNGVWSLYVMDANAGDAGQVAAGWNLTFTSLSPVNNLADLAITASTSPSAATVGDDFTWTFVVTNHGPQAATGVTLTNALPPGVTLVSAAVSQGNTVVNGGKVTANLATLSAGQIATVTLVGRPDKAALPPGAVAGSLPCTAGVTAFENDLQPLNNQVTVNSALSLPVTDAAVSIAADAAAVITGSNLVYTITVTNGGPGKALNVVLTDTLGASARFISAAPSQGTAQHLMGVVTARLGDLAPGATASLAVTIWTSYGGPLVNQAALTTDSNDADPGNHTASLTVLVEDPSPKIVAAGAWLRSESGAPDNALEPGETVQIAFGLANLGLVDGVSLAATLLPTGGVSSPSGPENYGAILAGGTPVVRTFAFTVDPAASGAVTASLQLRDGARELGVVSFRFGLPRTISLSNTNVILIPDHGPASPYPAGITVTEADGVVGKATATLRGLTHRFPSDVNALLAAPSGRSVLLMSHAGGSYPITNASLKFDDLGPDLLPQGSPLGASGVYKPARYERPVSFPQPAPVAPYGYELSSLAGEEPNGTWGLYVLDDAIGDAGVIASGWTLELRLISPLPRLAATVSAILAGAVVSPAPGVVVFQGTITGQPDASYQILDSADLASWSLVTTLQTAGDGTASFADPKPVTGARFYRAVRVSP